MKKFLKLKKLNKWIIIIIDILIILLGFYIAFMLKFDFNPPKRNLQPFIRLIPFIIAFSFVFINIYDIASVERRRVVDMGISIFISLVILHVITMALTFIFRGFAFPRSIFMIAFTLQFLSLIFWKAFLIHFSKKVTGVQRVLIIGNKQESEEVAKKILMEYKRHCQIKNFVHPTEINRIKNMIDKVDTLVICPKLEKDIKSQLVSLCLQKNKKIYIVPELYEISLLKSKFMQFDDMLGLEIEKLELSIEDQFIKRTFDIFISIISIIITSPFMILSAILVKFSSKGPILYKQERLTINDKPFKVYKFRTMVDHAEKYTGPVLAIDKDPRITKVGKLLRATRLDELPQLFNVLKGDMSIVGPRPERDYFIHQFIKTNPHFIYRTNVKAGITGLAQVYGKYSTSPEDKLRYDLLYITNYSFKLDLILILKTIKTMFIKASSKGIEEDKTLQQLLKEQDQSIFSEIGITNIEE
ncbi:sugar transferase [Garciella nitratireducens]|uniref:sugar transferase n=1 Tax=Garciella nitratireducens TaxID=218205 RepID=UPI000DE8B84C|nr:sugar transferase [Garciella nitratireducens]RBP37821.1 exopolysaccharide biosynthesis polyprenyl glycosylphosphotransferase [Garciella nitratireducens]